MTAARRSARQGLDLPLAGVVGGKTAKALADGLGCLVTRDLLLHLPRRYMPRGELTALGELADGDWVTVSAEVTKVESRKMRNRPGTMLEITVSDHRDSLVLTYFNRRWRDKHLEPGRSGLFAGRVSSFRGRKQLTHPDHVLLPRSADDDPEAVATFADPLVPVYPATAQIASWQISRAVRVAVDRIDWGSVRDPIPEPVRRKFGLVDLDRAIRDVHRPATLAAAEAARHRLRWDEALALQVALAVRRAQAGREPAVARPRIPGGFVDELDKRLPFELTSDQAGVGATLEAEMSGTTPMMRLLQGEVGSGKTVVALRAMLQVVEAGGQAALLAPTEVLAAQHARSLRDLLGPLAEAGLLGGSDVGTRLTLVTGSQSGPQRRAALAEAASGEAGIVIGTHALLEDVVEFDDLGLVVIDEQHRFGVEQRARMVEKARGGTRPHVLVMTATPIPRTVAMTVFGDLDVATLRNTPSFRAGATTHVVAVSEKPGHLQRVWERAREEVAAGRQVYVVCPRIDANDAVAPSGPDDAPTGAPTPGASVEQMVAGLRSGQLRDSRIAALHSRLGADEKDSVMRRFANGPEDPQGIDVLVSTTVIEVGVDVHNATMMVVVDADRFGVSQLHQLRGRVGRGDHEGVCLLLTSAEKGTVGRSRVEAVAAQTDGFALARFDLSERREGDVLGTMQAGRRSSLRMLSLLRDEQIIADARAVAGELVRSDPGLVHHEDLAEATRRLLPDEADLWLDRT